MVSFRCLLLAVTLCLLGALCGSCADFKGPFPYPPGSTLIQPHQSIRVGRKCNQIIKDWKVQLRKDAHWAENRGMLGVMLVKRDGIVTGFYTKSGSAHNLPAPTDPGIAAFQQWLPIATSFHQRNAALQPLLENAWNGRKKNTCFGHRDDKTMFCSLIKEPDQVNQGQYLIKVQKQFRKPEHGYTQHTYTEHEGGGDPTDISDG